MDDITPTLAAKSDQLNAADLMGSPATVRVLGVSINNSVDQPVIIKIDGGYQPYKPCKSMRRLLAQIWGSSSKDWVGQSLTVFCDPEVTWAGQAVGGIRISHVTGLNRQCEIPLRSSKTKVITYTIHPLIIELPAYTDDALADNSEAWIKAFESGETTPDRLINVIKSKFTISSAQEKAILSIQYSKPDK